MLESGQRLTCQDILSWLEPCLALYIVHPFLPCWRTFPAQAVFPDLFLLFSMGLHVSTPYDDVYS